MERWFLNRDANWIVDGLRRNVGSFNSRPSQKQIRNLFKDRKRGTIYYELWKRTGRAQYFYNSRLGVNEYRREYALIEQKEIPVTMKRRK